MIYVSIFNGHNSSGGELSFFLFSDAKCARSYKKSEPSAYVDSTRRGKSEDISHLLIFPIKNLYYFWIVRFFSASSFKRQSSWSLCQFGIGSNPSVRLWSSGELVKGLSWPERSPFRVNDNYWEISWNTNINICTQIAGASKRFPGNSETPTRLSHSKGTHSARYYIFILGPFLQRRKNLDE